MESSHYQSHHTTARGELAIPFSFSNAVSGIQYSEKLLWQFFVLDSSVLAASRILPHLYLRRSSCKTLLKLMSVTSRSTFDAFESSLKALLLLKSSS